MTRTAAMRTRRRANAGACLRDQRGLSTLEYALLFVLIMVGALALWRKLGTSLAANVEAGQHTLSQTLDSATAANRDPSSSGPGLMAPGPASNAVGSTANRVRGRATSPSGAASQPMTVSSTRPAVAAARSGTTSAVARPVEPQARGLLEHAKDYLVNTPGAQYALGIAAGILQGYTPGGFLVPSPYASSKPFELGRGLGQMGAGIADTVAGLGMVGGGGAATGVGALASVTPGSPAGVALVALGVPTIAAGVAVVASGVSATLAGYGTFINAMSMSDAAPPSGGSSGSGSGSPPPAKASANASRAGAVVGREAGGALLRAANQPFKNSPLALAGRALTKHPEVISLTKQTLNQTLRNPAAINAAAEGVIGGILRSGTAVVRDTPRFGRVLDITAESGFGARFSEAGDFITFLNP